MAGNGTNGSGEPVAIGKSMLRRDAPGKVTGETHYPADIDLPGQLWLKLRFSDRVHARITSVDTSAAEALPGVVAVYTAKDVPHNEYGLVIKDQPVLCGLGGSNPAADTVRCYMDCVAVVVAETEAIAADAVKLIQVGYEDLPGVFDMAQALRPEAPQIHPRWNGNKFSHYKLRKGDMAAGFAEADVIVEGTYETGYQEHAFLQPEAGLAYLDDEGRVTVVVAGQWAHEDLWQVSHALGLPHDRVRIIYPAVGGAFGGREDMSVQIVLALAAMKLGRPVKTQWSREESILYHHKRHPFHIQTKWGAKRDGTITAISATLLGDAGPYAYTSTKVVANAALLGSGPYECENLHIDAIAVVTNNIPSGAFRGFGAPQAMFAAEGQINKLAEALGMDPVAIRMKNGYRDGSITSVQTPVVPGCTLIEVLDACARESYWPTQANGGWVKSDIAQPRDPALRRGVGLSVGMKNIGYSFGYPEHSWAGVELRGKDSIDEVIVRAVGAEVGQGSHTAFVQMAAEAVGVPVEKVRLESHDTTLMGSSGSASASRLTFMQGNAIRGAAQKALEAWAHEERPAVGIFEYNPPKTTPFDPETGYCDPNFAYAYTAMAVEVEVDIETGHVRLERVVSINDVGRAINPQLIVGQVEGGVVQAQGYALMENLISKEGRILNPYLSTYLIPTALDVPTEVKTVILEYADHVGPFGVRGVAELPLIPLAPAIAAAVHDATGVWVDQIPMTPDRVVKALRAHGIGAVV